MTKKKQTSKQENETASEPSLAIVPVIPKDLYRQAENVAEICKAIVERTAVNIKGKKFPPVEAWEAIATAHGCHAGARDVERVYDAAGELIGYKAIGEIRTNQGVVIALGEGYVGLDEKDRDGKPTWALRAEYARRAMAQTRSISRVCRSVFAHVLMMMKIKDLQTTPAEEVPQDGFPSNDTTHHHKPTKAYEDQPAKDSKTAKADLATLREWAQENGVEESSIMAIAKKHKLGSTETDLDSLRPGTLTRLLAMRKYILQQIAEPAGAAGETNSEYDQTPPAEGTRTFMLADKITAHEYIEQEGYDKWEDVPIHFGVNNGTRLGAIDSKKLFGWVKNWTAKKYKGSYSDGDYLLDAALCLASAHIESKAVRV